MAEVLWLSNETPDRNGQGGQRRQFFQLQEVSRAGHQVTLCSLDGPQDDTAVRQLATVLRTKTHWRGRVRRPGHRRLLDRLAEGRWDALVLAHTESWPTFRDVVTPARAPIWVDLHNVLGHDIHRRRTPWAAVEEAICGAAGVVSVCSDQERERLQEQQHDIRAQLTVMHHGIDPAEWTTPRTPARMPVVKLFGNWAWGPNARGLEWFLTEVWPAVEVAGARCEIAGSGVVLPRDTRDVRFVGRVPALDAWTSNAWAIAVPVMGGVGAPVKYLEALATRAPVLSTPDGAPSASDAAALVSADPTRWAQALQTVLTRPGGPVTTHVDESTFTWKNASAPLLRWLEHL